LNTEPEIDDIQKRKWLIFAVVALTIIMATLDASIVNIALPVIRADFNVGITIVEWVVIAYMLTVVSLLMISGRIADIYGQKKIYIAGILIFVIGSGLCALSKSINELIIFRAIQGLGAACSMANGNAIITNFFPPQERGKALGLVGASVAVGLSAGPVLGGMITTYFGWRYIFLFNLPLGTIALISAFLVLRESSNAKGAVFDFTGAFTLSAVLITFVLSLTKYPDWGFAFSGILLLISLIGFVVFVIIEKRVKDPMVDLALFRDDKFAFANLAAFLSFSARFAVIFLIPFYLVDLRGLKPNIAGLVLTPVPLLLAVMSPLVGALSDKIGTRYLTTIGMIFSAIGFGMLILIGTNTSILYIIVCMLISGFGGGLFGSPNTSTIMGSVPKDRLGNAGAMNALVRNVGMIVGIAWSGALFAAVRGHDLPFEASIDRIVPAFRAAMQVSVVLTLFAAYASFRRSEMRIYKK